MPAGPRLQRLTAALDGATRALDKLFAAVTVLILAFVVGANGLEILRRNLFGQSFLWLYESNLLASNWMYFLGMSLVVFRRKDITLDFILLLLRGRVRCLYVIGVNVVAMATFAVVAYYGVLLMRLQMPFRTSGYGIPNPLFTLPVVLSACAIVLILVRQSLDLWISGELPPGGHESGAEAG